MGILETEAQIRYVIKPRKRWEDQLAFRALIIESRHFSLATNSFLGSESYWCFLHGICYFIKSE
jgi:hypothetical protein